MGKNSEYLKFLPSTFHGPLEEGEVSFISRYLKIFEKILSGIDDEELNGKKGIGEILDGIPFMFHPRFSFLFEKTDTTFMPSLGSTEKDKFKNYFRADSDVDTFMDDFVDDFMGWLASWVALVLKEDWELEKKRKVISKIIPIYRMRGTRRGIMEFLRIYVGGEVDVFEKMDTFQVGESEIGTDTLIGGGMKAYSFIVKVKIPKIDRKEQKRTLRNLKIVLDAEKPVHTTYLLKVSVPTLHIGDENGSKVGENTLIGGTFTEIHT